MAKEVRTFAVHRMKSATCNNATFEVDGKIINSVTVDDFLGYERVKNVKLQVARHLREQLEAHPLHTMQKITGEGIVEIPSVARETLIPWLLAQQTAARLIEPESLRGELRQILSAMRQLY